MRLRQVLLILGFALVAIFGYWLAGTAAPKIPPTRGKSADPDASKPIVTDETMPKFRRAERPAQTHRRDSDALAAGAMEGQRVLVFKDKDALARFLSRAGDRIRLLGKLDALNALRVGFDDHDDLASLLDDAEEAYIYPVNAPAPPDGTVQQGAAALGSHLLDWLGVTGDNSEWGRGVRIAVLDTGVTANQAFTTSINSINLVALPSDPALQNGHGTAVASVIIGNNPLTPGVAPGASVLSVRIADDNGQSDSFMLAQGIVAAVDAGVNIINISMGSQGDSGIVRNAVRYALSHGALIVAAAGNNGLDSVSYPAANEGVIAVGAVDALGYHLDFSNSGDSVAISAPGYAVNAAWSGNEAASVTGTSFSSPIVAGAIAAVMTQAGNGKLTAAQAWQLLTRYLNDGGAAGTDPQLGAGMPDIGRVLNANTRGIYDAAVASTRILPPDGANPYGQVEVLVQNRGTEMLINTSVTVSTGAGAKTTNLTSLAPNAVKTVRIPITRPPSSGNQSFTVMSQVRLSNGTTDAKPSNDRRSETYVASGGN